MKYEFHPAALQEYAEAVQFFAQQARHQDFIDTIENAIFKIIGALFALADRSRSDSSLIDSEHDACLVV